MCLHSSELVSWSQIHFQQTFTENVLGLETEALLWCWELAPCSQQGQCQNMALVFKLVTVFSISNHEAQLEQGFLNVFAAQKCVWFKAPLQQLIGQESS